MVCRRVIRATACARAFEQTCWWRCHGRPQSPRSVPRECSAANYGGAVWRARVRVLSRMLSRQISPELGWAQIGALRDDVRSWLGSHQRADDVVLVVSELSTNALLHAGGGLLEVRRTATADHATDHEAGDVVDVEVTSPTTASAGKVSRWAVMPGRAEVTGRGLAIIGAVADRCKVSSAPAELSVRCRFG